MSKLGFAAGTAAGALLMYELDPARGRRRRSRLIDRARHTARVTTRSLRKASDDGSQRLRGVVARLRPARPADDELLASRVRAMVGRHCSHPHAIRVVASAGVVELSGPIFADEAALLLTRTRFVPGVVHVVDRLERHATPEGVPALQGPARRHGLARARESWPPSIRWLIGGAGATAFALGGLRRPSVLGILSMAAGATALARALSNERITAFLGLAPEPGIRVNKTVTIEAPVEEVFSFFSAFENFPKFMQHVDEVRDLGENRFHWKVSGPVGEPLEWDGAVKRRVENELIEWESAPGAIVHNRGRARFERAGDRATRLGIDLVYQPPLGELGHAVAKLLGSDPKHELDADLLRFKSLLESGKVATNGP